MGKVKVKKGHGGTEVKIPREEGFLKQFRPKTFYQKSMRINKWDSPFAPTEYTGQTSEQRSRMAYEDAEQHADFYRDLVKQGVYPLETKVNVKRKKHSDAYFVELWMPRVTTLKKDLLRVFREGKIGDIIERIETVSKKHGYQGWKFDEDVYFAPKEYREGHNFPGHHFRNYGLDDNGRVRYIDVDILLDKLPFAGRKSNKEINKEDWNRKERRRNLERKVLPVTVVTCFILSLFFLSPNVTGNTISNFSQNSTNILGVTLFIVSVLIGIFSLRNKELKQPQNQP